jgi:hypothetical protein
MSSKANEIVATLVQLGVLRSTTNGGIELAGAKLATVGPNTVLLDGSGNALITFDVDGNIVANIVHRTDSLATLLVTPSSAGEIAVATDSDAIVVYKGDPVQGLVYGRTTLVGEVFLPGSFQTYPNGVKTLIPFGAVSSGGYGTSAYILSLFDAVNKWFTAPPAAFASHFTVDVAAMFSDGTVRMVGVEIDYDSSAGGDGSAWTSLGVATGGASVANSQPGKKHRLTVVQSSGATLYSASITPVLQFRKA